MTKRMPWTIDDEKDPYLSSVDTFVVPPADPTVEHILEQSDLTAGLLNQERYQWVSLVDYYGLHLAIDLVGQLGLTAHLSTSRTVSELREAKGFVSAFEAPLEWVLERLAAADLISVEESGDQRRYRIDVPLRSPRLDWLRNHALKGDAAILSTLDLMRAVADGYPGVARGEVSGEQLLWASIKLWTAFLSEGNWYYDVTNQVASRCAAALLPSGCNAALEVGAGLGSGTRSLLGALAGRGLINALGTFRVTEPDAFLRRRLERSLKIMWPQQAFEFAAFDINDTWADQGVEPESFALIFGVNVFHLARDLHFSLREAFHALSPGGWIVLGEGMRLFPGQPVAIELVFQMLRDFVEVRSTANRPTRGFLDPEAWQRSLQSAGFCDIEVVPDLVRIRQRFPRLNFGAACGRKPEDA